MLWPIRGKCSDQSRASTLTNRRWAFWPIRGECSDQSEVSALTNQRRALWPIRGERCLTNRRWTLWPIGGELLWERDREREREIQGKRQRKGDRERVVCTLTNHRRTLWPISFCASITCMSNFCRRSSSTRWLLAWTARSTMSAIGRTASWTARHFCRAKGRPFRSSQKVRVQQRCRSMTSSATANRQKVRTFAYAVTMNCIVHLVIIYV